MRLPGRLPPLAYVVTGHHDIQVTMAQAAGLGVTSLSDRHFHDYRVLSRLSVASVGDLPGLSHTNP